MLTRRTLLRTGAVTLGGYASAAEPLRDGWTRCVGWFKRHLSA